MAATNEKQSVRLPYGSLIVALLLSAMGTPVLKALVQKGGHFGTALQNALSYCNILFVGNLCSALIVFLYFWPPRIFQLFKKITRERWGSLLANTILANIISPILIVLALEDAGDITAVILLLQTNTLFYALFSWLIFGATISRRTFTGLGVIVLGAIVLLALPGNEPIGKVHLCTLGAAICRSLGSCLARKTLEDESIMPAFLVLRNLIGAVGFFGLAIQMFGLRHFPDAFSPGLWKLMVVYAAFVVVLAQLTWFRAVSRLSTEVVSTWSTVVPALALLFAWLFVGDYPSPTQWVSVAIIFLGLAIAKVRFKAIPTPVGTVEPHEIGRPLTGT
jgi:drug/metabolite transporter (DMT)-like permease